MTKCLSHITIFPMEADLFRDRSPNPVTFQNLAQRADFGIDCSARLSFALSDRLQRRNVVGVDIGD
jgi:hypothetical protein